MDKKRLIYFTTLAEKMHFGATAEKLNIAQSALSRQISLLEEELGCQLFDRTNKWNVSLTSAGNVFLDEAKKIIAQMDNASRLTAAAARGESGKFCIELVPSAVNVESFLAALRYLHKDYLDLHLSIRNNNSKVIRNHIMNEDADLGIVRMAPINDEILQMRALTHDRLIAAIPKQHKLACKEKIYLSDFKNQRLMLQSSNDATPLRSLLDIICHRAGFTPNVIMEIENLTTLLSLLPVLNSLTILPESFTRFNDELVYRPLEDCIEELPISAIWRSDNNSTILKQFLKVLLNPQSPSNVKIPAICPITTLQPEKLK